MKKLFHYFKPYIWQFVVLLILVFGMVAANLQLPDYMARIINDGIVKQDTHLIWRVGLEMLGLALAGGLANVIVGYFAARIATGFARDIRAAQFAQVESFSLTEFNKFSTASLITRSTNDIQQIQMVTIMLLRMALMAPIMGVWAIVKAYANAPSMTWIMGLAVGILIIVIATTFTVAVPRFRKLQKLVDKLNLVTREILTGLRVIRAFNRESAEEKKFDQANVDLTKLNLFVNRLMVIMMPFMMLLMNVITVGVVWVGARLVDTSGLQIGNMMAFMMYAIQVIFSFLMVSIIFIMVPRASVSLSRVAEVINTEATIKDPTQATDIANIHTGRIEFDHVTFAYSGADTPVLRDLSFIAEPGQTTAFVGSTGSGKSTIINLIPRFYDVTGGAVKIDGVDVRAVKMEDLYRKIGYVPQKGILFSGTVASNLKYGAPDASDDAVKHAAEIAQAGDFIATLKEQYQAPIAQGGTNVSGGQKQRLAIARAIIRDPEIYIFDDTFSALDFKTDAALRRALAKETKDKTVLIVAQRIGTIMNADKIIVLDEGRIVGQGTHRELMKSCPVYHEIASSQLSAEELQGLEIKPALGTTV